MCHCLKENRGDIINIFYFDNISKSIIYKNFGKAVSISLNAQRFDVSEKVNAAYIAAEVFRSFSVYVVLSNFCLTLRYIFFVFVSLFVCAMCWLIHLSNVCGFLFYLQLCNCFCLVPFSCDRLLPPIFVHFAIWFSLRA